MITHANANPTVKLGPAGRMAVTVTVVVAVAAGSLVGYAFWKDREEEAWPEQVQAGEMIRYGVASPYLRSTAEIRRELHEIEVRLR